MRFESIIAPKAGQVKTASAQATDAAVQAATQAVRPASPSAAEGINKLASDLVSGNRTDEQQHAIKLGTYLFEGFLQASTAYEQAATKIAAEKAAELEVTADELQLVRMLRENPEDFVQRGMTFARSKIASDQSAKEAYDETVKSTVAGFRKVAAQHYAAGYEAIVGALSA